MKSHHLIFKLVLVVMFFLILTATTVAQSISGADAAPPDPGSTDWVVEVAFVPNPAPGKIKQIFLVNIEDVRIIQLNSLTSAGKGIYVAKPSEALETTGTSAQGTLKFAKHYELRAAVENSKGDDILSLGVPLELIDPRKAENKRDKAAAKSSEDADIYVSGELNGAHKKRTSFTTEIKLQKYKAITPSWAYTPFFKLNASTDPDADPDKMEAGLKTRYIIGNAAYFNNDIKLESERDFDNTNFIYDTRLTFLPPAFPKGFKKLGENSKLTTNNYKVFVNPFIGGEFGKNLRSPLQAAEGDGIARLLAGVDLRIAIFIKKNEKAPDINWTTSYARRWLLTDELSFKADDDGNLQLRTFGKSPRDYVLSKFSYKLTKFFDVFTAYEWGQVPPSYKLVDHRFRVGFAYKYKFGVQ